MNEGREEKVMQERKLGSESVFFTEISPRIWQIQDDLGVFVTLIKGDELAILVDTGWGNKPLRRFVERSVRTPYIVVNSHGHPDHIGGNRYFKTVYANAKDFPMMDGIESMDEKVKFRNYERMPMHAGAEIDLGDVQVKVVDLKGHTPGSIGFLVEEERILISGDALNESIWMLADQSLSLDVLYETIERTMELDFDLFVGGHSKDAYPKEKLNTHLYNISHLIVDKETICDTSGYETYRSEYIGPEGRSEIIFTEDKLSV